ncbi:FAD-dependent oxidoreductase [Micrococcoides hystricis]|uniref:FAD-dependent oxidoreductase n=1 Tax=Micrococcoides hystricis TaxID=1572761 RepID=A0ABV6P9V6_9MICC
MAIVKLVIVGGVAAGMSAAARARRLNEQADITVFERGDYVSYANCGLPYYVGGVITFEDDLLLHTPESLRAALNLDVRTGHEVTGIDAENKTVTVQPVTGPETEPFTVPYDKLILSPGADPIRLPLPGFDSDRVHELRTVPDAQQLHALVSDEAADPVRTAVVLGAGFIGLEATEALAARGIDVHLVELVDHVLPPLEAELAYPLKKELERIGVRVHTGVAAEEIVPGEACDLVHLTNGDKLPAELIIASVGVRPATEQFASSGLATERGAIIVDEHGRTNLPDVYAAGDAVLSVDAVTGLKRPVPLAGPANRAGRLIADHIFTPEQARPIPTVQATAIVRVGKLTAAMTGANRASLDEAGIDYQTLHLQPLNHAGYFPGASRISLVAHIDQQGQLLGAQAVGESGVDKRIDVLATAIAAKMPVTDLIDLDFSYSPPYGSAKDPVNFLGMVAQNVMSEKLKLWHPTLLEETTANIDSGTDSPFLLDVRSQAEYNSGHLYGAMLVPHTQIRERLEDILEATNGNTIYVYCASGVRSYLATRILTQAGADARSLSGGFTTATDYFGDRETALITVPTITEQE